MVKVYGRITSSNVMKVLWTLSELGLDYDRVDAGMAYGVVDTPEYRAMNPNGRVPTVQDGELILWESNAIVRYLAAKHGGEALWPSDLAHRADLDRWMDWQQTTLNPAFTPVFWGLVRTAPEDQNHDTIKAAVGASCNAMAMLEHRLKGQKWLGGDALSMADIPLGPNVHRFFNLDFERPKLPNVCAWYDRMCERPAFQQHVSGIPIE